MDTREQIRSGSPFDRDASSQWLLHEDALILEKIALHPDGAPEIRPHREALILRDDLLHPWANGNKLRKLDGYLPELQARGVTDILTCGGVQSAHCAALASLCAERGVRAHVLLRGEAPAQMTGNFAITSLYAQSVTWVARDSYADREAMLDHHARKLTRRLGPASNLHVIPEGASNALALRGLVRLIERLIHHLPNPEAPWRLLIDSGTGTSAAGLLAGILIHDLPWSIRSVMLVPDQHAHYTRTITELATEYAGVEAPGDKLIMLDRRPPRRFGKLVAAEIIRCRQTARLTGVLFDPIYTLAAYDELCHQSEEHDARTLLIHTGGALNLFGVMSRKPHLFQT